MVSGRDRDPAFRKKPSTTKKTAAKKAPPSSDKTVTNQPKTVTESDKTVSEKQTPPPVSEPKQDTFKPSTVEKPKPTTPEEKKEPRVVDSTKTSKKSKFLGVIVAILFMIGLVALGYVVIQSIAEKEEIKKLDNSFSNDGVKALGPNSTSSISEGEDESSDEIDSPQDGAIGQEIETSDEENNSTELSNDNSMESEMNEAKNSHAEKSKSAQEKEAIKSKIIRKKGEFELPSWIIAFSANSKKPLANTNYSTLEALGYDAGIYWIPKYFPGGSEMYKVYVGPYKTASEAESMLPAIRNLQPDAYVLKIDE